MPFKANADRRHHIAKQQGRATNSAANDAALRQRGSLTVWFTKKAIAACTAEPRTTGGGQSRHSALAIATALHIGTDADTGHIVARTLTGSNTCDASQVYSATAPCD